MEFSNALTAYIKEPELFGANFELAVQYEKLGQTASAASFYLRAAERTIFKSWMYEALIKASQCFEKQGARNFTVKGLLQRAIALQPNRPEAYYFLSRLYERETYDGHWNDCYLMASIGCTLSSEKCKLLVEMPEYPGDWACTFEKAVSAWWCGLCDESRIDLEWLLTQAPLDPIHYAAVFDNLKRLGSPLAQYQPFEIYTKKDYPNLKGKFSRSKEITRNFSEAFQDLFVLKMLTGKLNGVYLEVGAGHPTYGNNTYLLEDSFGWTGKSIDIDSDVCENFKKSSRDPRRILNKDALSYFRNLGYGFSEAIIDYLQLDCDPPETTFRILTEIPFDEMKFRVITYEHDAYLGDDSYQKKAHEFLESKGYLRVVKNVSPDGIRNFEDWYVHPELVNMDTVRAFSTTDDSIKKARDLFLK